MTLMDIQRALMRDALYESAKQAMAGDLYYQGRITERESKCERICLHINEDGTALISLHADQVRPLA